MTTITPLGHDGLPRELFKARGDNLIRCMYLHMYRIWLEKSVYNDWNLVFALKVLTLVLFSTVSDPVNS